MLTDIDRKKRIVRVAIMLSMAITCGAWGRVIYVDDDAVAPGDGSSWQTAYKFLQDALTHAKTADKPIEIRVAQGIYKPDRDSAHPQGNRDRNAHFLLTDGTDLLGGYAGLSGPDPNARDIQSYETILSGDLLGNDAPVIDPAALRTDPTRDDNSGGVVRVTRGPIRLEGCTVAGGSGLALVVGLDMVVSDCTFRGNRCFGGSNPMPGAVYVSTEGAGSWVLRRCSFIENAGDMGALQGSGVLVDSCRFTRNYGAGYGGGAASLRGSTIINCVFTENRVAGSGGALSLTGISGTNRVVGCIFRGNRAGGGGPSCAMDIRM
jgi:hypothetical protein